MKRRLLWIVEVFIWLLILFLVSDAIMFAKYEYKKNFNTYQIFLSDVDGLVNGSPVKILGIQIGYVNQINIVGEDVYVRFIITDQNVKIPPGTIATVEFSGLGGSKSLELYPPTSKDIPSDKIIIAQSPKRIHDSLGLLNDMFDKAIGIAYTISHFMDQVGMLQKDVVIKANGSPKTAGEFLKYSNDWIDKAQNQCDTLDKKINGEKNGRRKNKNN